MTYYDAVRGELKVDRRSSRALIVRYFYDFFFIILTRRSSSKIKLPRFSEKFLSWLPLKMLQSATKYPTTPQNRSR